MVLKKLQYLFRRPRYPLLCSVPGDLIGAWSLEQLEDRLSHFDLPATAVLHIIDATGEGWALNNQFGAVSPLTMKKSWKKAELLDLYRQSASARHGGVLLKEKALLRQRLDVLILSIAELLRDGPPSKSPTQTVGRAGKSDSQQDATALPAEHRYDPEPLQFPRLP